MNLREVTVGRSANCDIYLDQGCKYANGLHGTIYYDGNQLMFKDSSTNGTWINNIKVHKRAVPIHHGDIIMIAGKYQVNWNQIDSYFPTAGMGVPSPMANHAVLYGPPIPYAQSASAYGPSSPVAPAVAVDTSKFSWGAFFLSGIWGLFNGCWWMILVNIVYCILAFIPVVNIFTGIAAIITNLIFGFYGTRWAWSNRTWSSPVDFLQTQKTWDKVAIILFIVNICLSIVGVLIILGTFATAFS